MKFVALHLPMLALLAVFIVQGVAGDAKVLCKNAGGRCVAENSCRKIDELNEGSCPNDNKVCCKSGGVPANRGPKPVHRGGPRHKPVPIGPRPPVYAKSGQKVTRPRISKARQSVMCAGTEKRKCIKAKGKCQVACSSTEKEIKNGCSSPGCICCKKVCRKGTCAAGKGTCVKKRTDCSGTINGSTQCTIPGSSKKCYCCLPGGTTKPPTTEPPTTKPSTTKPSTTKPSTTKPPTTEPPTTKPSTTKPSTTEPPTTKPSTTKPPTTEPSTTKPSTTKPPTTTAPPSG